MGIVSIIVIGFVAGIIARLVSPGPNNPSASSSPPLLVLRGRSSRPGSAS